MLLATAAGRLAGRRRRNVVSFLGVPYARATTGPRRFAPPEPIEPWTGVLAAHHPAPAAFQVTRGTLDQVAARAASMAGDLPGIAPYPPEVADALLLDASSEMGLFLDVHTPAVVPDRPLPVYVHYHGGGNAVGSAAGAAGITDGANLARSAGVVVVQPQYRLGAIGWIHNGLIDSDPGAATNVGLQDQMAALEWVHANIQDFGGDPTQITVGGESAGATAVSHLITHPRMRPYIRRAVLQSFTPFMTWSSQPTDEGVAAAAMYRRILGVGTFSDLRRADPVDLLAAQAVLPRLLDSDTLHAYRPLGPVVDGDHVTQRPVTSLATSVPTAHPLEVMIGFAKDEWQFFRGHAPFVQGGDYAAAIRVLSTAMPADTAGDLLAAYSSLHPGHDPGHLLSDICSFLYFKLPALELADDLTARGVPVQVYQYAYDHPGLDGRLRATHTGALPMLFHNYDAQHLARWPSLEGADPGEIEQIAQCVGPMVSSFLRTGRPGADWSPWDGQEQPILWFGRAIETRRRLLSAERAVIADAGLGTVQAVEAILAANTHTTLDRLAVNRKL